MSDHSSYSARVAGLDTRVQVTIDGLDIGDRLIAWLDIDRIAEGDHRIALGLSSGSELEITGLGAVHDRFVNEMREARRRVRLPALSVATGNPRESFVSREADGWIDLHLYDDVLVLDRRSGETTPIPLSLIDAVERRGHDFIFTCRGLGEYQVGKLGAATDHFADLLERTRREQRTRLAAAAAAFDARLTGCSLPDGWAVGPDDEPTWWVVLGDVAAAGERGTEFRHLQQISDRPVRLGLTTSEGENSMSFGLFVRGRRIAVESLSGEARATFVFESDDPDRLNAALVAACFRRDVIALPEDQLGRWAVAVRASPIVRELRNSLVARVEHREGWVDSVRRAVGD